MGEVYLEYIFKIKNIFHRNIFLIFYKYILKYIFKIKSEREN